MLLFTDIITDDEMLTDSYDMKEINDIVYEVDGKQIVIQEGDVDIGGNPSAEEQAEALESGAEQVIDVVHSAKLQQTSFDKKGYLTYLKGYMKSIKNKLQESNPDRVPAFEKGAAEFAKKIVANFKDYEFYTGESMNPDGMVVLLNYREDGVTPYFIFWKDGLKSQKI
ncbi:translationally-controlled tumor protein [Tilletiaria anomala UBC 951]|uniref:Translationally-controlled tumor protein homolog n=1 Tax=Tilletiaria anomala (strain ATCC 24038 / CBS 436.72 / UBC 951) TaxID=1037660 RepID=A0A066V7I7_TILAU|nr:translationally-controlled tumor protein [Tilletiaria anomala UBC 951]KDN37411.1 translationally-controlled tumor protein [Tilletiaria anomala UBC 951]